MAAEQIRPASEQIRPASERLSGYQGDTALLRRRPFRRRSDAEEVVGREGRRTGEAPGGGRRVSGTVVVVCLVPAGEYDMWM